MLIALSRVRAHHPFRGFGPANQVTAMRALLVALVAGCIGEAPGTRVMTSAVAAAAMAMILDGADGWLARRTGMASAFGARFDLEVDALLILVLAVLAWQWHKAGAWVLLAGLMRYLFVIAGRFWVWMRRPLRPTFRGKAICIVQVLSLIVAIVPGVRRPASGLVAALGLSALSYSFFIDSRWLWAERGEG
jgi:phosphatidylglycerophosphate synthase